MPVAPKALPSVHASGSWSAHMVTQLTLQETRVAPAPAKAPFTSME